MSSEPPGDRRRHERFRLMEYVLIHREGCSQPTRAMMRDVSLGGAQLQTKEARPAGELAVLHIGRGEDVPLQIHAEVRHCQPVEGSELFAVGYRFRPASISEKTAVVDYVHAVFVEQGERLL